jgi:hypothetical protein
MILYSSRPLWGPLVPPLFSLPNSRGQRPQLQQILNPDTRALSLLSPIRA